MQVVPDSLLEPVICVYIYTWDGGLFCLPQNGLKCQHVQGLSRFIRHDVLVGFLLSNILPGGASPWPYGTEVLDPVDNPYQLRPALSHSQVAVYYLGPDTSLPATCVTAYSQTPCWHCAVAGCAVTVGL